MKRFLVFIVLLVSSISKILACGYSPFGEDVRYCLLKPEYFNFTQYRPFYYSADMLGVSLEINSNNDKTVVESNILDWYNYTKKKVSIDAIEDFHYQLSLTDIHPKSNNDFIEYLYQNNKKEAIAYLKTAKNCEAINNFFEEDLWERKETQNNKIREQLLEQLVQITKKESNSYFKRKYAFLTIRLAHYANNKELVKIIYEQILMF